LIIGHFPFVIFHWKTSGFWGFRYQTKMTNEKWKMTDDQ